MVKKVLLLAGVILLFFFIGTRIGSPSGAVIVEDSVGGAQIVNLGLDRSGYVPKVITVEANKPVVLKNDGSLQGCALYPVQPELGLKGNFAKSSEATFTPSKKGDFVFTCSMGMWKGTIRVI